MTANTRPHWAILLLLATLSFPAAGWAQRSMGPYHDVAQLPDTPAGKRVKELIDVVNSDNPDRIKAFVQSTFTKEFQSIAPMEDHIDVFRETFARTGGLDFHSVRVYDNPQPPNDITAIVHTRLTDSWRGIMLTVEPEPPHLIVGLNFAPARPPSDLPKQPALTRDELVKELDRAITKLTDAGVFSGTALLAKDGQVWYESARGMASKRFNVPNNINTKFNLGSMNKMFTGVAVAQLAQRGKLSLDDPVSKYLSTDWLPQDIAAKIKIKHLLTHTSGLGSYFTDEFMDASRLRFRNLDDYKPIVSKSTLAFEPGTNWQYSNTGMLLAGVIVAKASGMSYDDYIRKYVTGPAGMTNTDCYEMDQPVPNLAIGYIRDPDAATGWRNNILLHVVKGGPAGGGYSTVHDLLRFDQALRSHRLLNKEYTDMVLTAKPELHSPDYGFGFGIEGTPGNRIVGHSGGFPGLNSVLRIFLDSGFTVAVMSNHDHGAMPVAEKMSELIRRLD